MAQSGPVAIAAPPPGIATAKPVADQVRVLLVEDDRDDQHYVCRTLKRHFDDPTVNIAESLAQARAALKAGEFDCIILDYSLPDGRGLELLEDGSVGIAGASVIVLTGMEDSSLGINAIRLGAQDYLVKGQMNDASLCRCIRYAIERTNINHELREARRQLEQISQADPLTGLLNRRGIEAHLVRELAVAERAGTPVAAVLVDCDDFKAVNTEHGHSTGDAVLATVAAALFETARETDHVARIGGDEFVLLLPIAGVAEAAIVAKRAQCLVARALKGKGLPEITISCGIVLLPPSLSSTTELLALAQGALGDSKVRGKNCVSSASAGQPDQVDRPGTLSRLLANPALLEVAYQPMYAVERAEPVGGELLIRGPAGELREPTALFGLATNPSQLVSFDLACAARCVQAAVAHQLAGQVSIHLLPVTLSAVYPAHILRMLAPAMARGPVHIELSEHTGPGPNPEIRERLRELRAGGVRVVLDCMGLSQSNLQRLILLKPDVVKLDRRLVTGCHGEPRRVQALVRMAELAHAMGVTVVAPGIESALDLAAVRAAGIGMGQGHYFAHPTVLNTGLAA